MTDPISDLLTRIRNAQHAGIEEVYAPYSKIKYAIAKKLADLKYLKSADISKKDKFQELKIVIDISRKYPLTFKRISKPGQKIYIKNAKIKKIKSGLGISIISTSKGVMTNNEARKQKLGGELICEIY